MNRCIFCKSTDEQFGTREHILPESLGGGDWAILPPGLFCDTCQNAFGSTIEQQALADYPFNLLRVLLGIPTKKRKAPWFDSWEGTVSAGPRAGQIAYEPAPPFEQAFKERRKTEMRFVATPRKPEMVCRTLLKMGLEMIAADTPDYVFHQKFDEARTFALHGTKNTPWWYAQVEDDVLMNQFLRERLDSVNESAFSLEVIRLENGDEVFYLHLFYLDIFTPLVSNVYPQFADEPKVRVFWS